ncbi:DUF899 domain-containing protein [Ornithinibacillus gellani]|uniref:DUF899 family protein n=1 Tax=Ornithinibacillus gellani TaxID=2293253 RepID=UPI000F4A8F63|nr:DUF899 family protein [Ornithinibacillus gellani]TQS74719.1 DUF899 domain-containing protein [Ornithinibacillus gellani]
MSEKKIKLPMFFSYFEWAFDDTRTLSQKKKGTSLKKSFKSDSSNLSMIEVDKEYFFNGPEGKVSLLDLFDSRNQLILGHFMFDPNWDKGCPDCSSTADQISDVSLKYLRNQDTSFAYVSRAPLEKIERYKYSMGWSFPWYSSFDSNYNYDFKATTDKGEMPGGSVFRRKGDSIFQVKNTEAAN